MKGYYTKATISIFTLISAQVLNRKETEKGHLPNAKETELFHDHESF